MSTGADCRLYEKEKGKWFYDLQRWPYGDNDQYDTFGPFPHYAATVKHLHDNHANPGGYSTAALPGCPHDMTHRPEYPGPGDEDMLECDRCGGAVTTLEYESWKAVLNGYLRKYHRTDATALLGDDAEPFMQAQHAERKMPMNGGLNLYNEYLKRPRKSAAV